MENVKQKTSSDLTHISWIPFERALSHYKPDNIGEINFGSLTARRIGLLKSAMTKADSPSEAMEWLESTAQSNYDSEFECVSLDALASEAIQLIDNLARGMKRVDPETVGERSLSDDERLEIVDDNGFQEVASVIERDGETFASTYEGRMHKLHPEVEMVMFG